MADTEMPQKPLNQVFQSRGTTIFTTMSDLAVKNEAINLGQGFPDVDGPLAMREEAARRVVEGPSQYPPAMGVAELRQAVAEHNKSAYGIELDWQSEIMVTSGATEALLDCLMGLVNPGDEVVLIEPFYDCYLPIIERAGAVPKVVSLTPPQWDVPQDQLEQAFSNKTKLILLNTPMNPCSKVFSIDELDRIAKFCLKHDAVAVCDEVYENLVFDNHKHVPLMTPAWHGRPLCADWVGRQELLVYRLENWLYLSTQTPDVGHCQGASIFYFHNPACSPICGCLRA